MNRKISLAIPSILIFLTSAAFVTFENDETGQQSGLDTSAGDGRILGIDINEISSYDYDTSIGMVKEIGVDFVQVPLFWDVLEPAPTQYNDELLNLLNLYYSSENLSLVLVLIPIDTGKSRVPSDLLDKKLDDPETILRFNSMIDHVHEKIPDVKLTGIAIGNEIDGYLGQTKKWNEFQNFYGPVREHIKDKDRWGNVPVGTKAMFYGLVGHYSEELRIINEDSDVIMVTYYPLNSDFTFRDPSVVHDDMELLVNQNTGKPIFILEVGYPSGSIVKSSTEKQREFIVEMFEAWDKNKERIKAVNFVWMHDINASSVSYYDDYYGVSDVRFSDFLGTLGMKYDDGSPKPSWDALREETAKRGWN